MNKTDNSTPKKSKQGKKMVESEILGENDAAYEGQDKEWNDLNGEETASQPIFNQAENFENGEDGEKFQKLKDQISELNDKYLRLVAEFDNFKKRTSKERAELFKTANKDVLVAIIPVIDDFERAEKAISTSKDPEAIKEGLHLVSNKLKNILSQQGLKEMKSIGEVFDTDMHEAVTNIPASVEDMKGKVIDEIEKGYLLNDKIIRYAKVIVGE